MGHKTASGSQQWPAWVRPYAREYLNQAFLAAAPGLVPAIGRMEQYGRYPVPVGFRGPGALVQDPLQTPYPPQGGPRYQPQVPGQPPAEVPMPAVDYGDYGFDAGFQTRAVGRTPQVEPVPFGGPETVGLPVGTSPLAGSALLGYPGAALQQVAPFDPAQAAALQNVIGTAGAIQGFPGLAMGELGATLGGAYLDPSTNPYLAGAYGTAARNMVDQYLQATAPSIAAQALRAGAFGGSAQQALEAQSRYSLGQNLADLANQMFGGAYEAERSRQLQAQGLVPSITEAQFLPAQAAYEAGTRRQAQVQRELDVATERARTQLQWPFEVLGQLATAISSAAGPQLVMSGASSRK